MIKVFKDMIGRKVAIHFPPQRIISLVPSQTELLYKIGLGDRIVGKTMYCVHTNSESNIAAKVGGTKSVKFDLINALKPDLIICNQEENTLEIVETLAQKYPVWISDVNDLESALQMIEDIGNITDKSFESLTLINIIKSEFLKIKNKTKKKCVYLIWRKPYMTVGSDTFIHNMLQYAGFENSIIKTRYPELKIQEIIDLNPDVILLSTEPYPFKQKHIAELEEFMPNTKILVVDGEMFSWYGSRLVNSPQYFKTLQTQ